MPPGPDAIEQIGIEVVAKTGGFFRSVDGAVNRAQGKFGSLAKNIGKAMVAATAVAGVALAAVGAASVKMAVDFEKSIAEVKTLLPELSETGFKLLQDDLLDLSQELGIATSELIPALYQAISAGVPPDNVIDFLRTGAKASIGGVTDLTTAIDGLTTITNAWGLESSEAGRIADVMFTGVKLGKTTMAELSASMFQAAPLAAALGISVEEVVAATATLTKSGVPTSVAMTQMRQAMVALTKPTADMTKLLEKTGFATGEALIEAKGFAGALEVLNQAANEDKEVLGKAFGSVEALGFVLGVTGDNAEGAAADLALVKDSAGAANEAFETMNKTVSRKLARVMNLFRVGLTKIGLRALPLVAAGLDKTADFVEDLGAGFLILIGYLKFVVKEGDTLNDFLVDLPKPLRPIVRLLGEMVLAGKAFFEVLRRRGRDELAFLNHELRNTPEVLRNIVFFMLKLVDLFKAVFSRQNLSAVGEIVSIWAELALAVGSEVFSDVVDLFTFLFDEVITPAVGILSALLGGFEDLSGEFEDSEPVWTRVKDILVALVEAWLVLLAAKKIVNLTQNIVRTGATFIKTLKSMAQTITQTITRVGAFFIDVKNIAQVWGQVITQEIKRKGAQFIDVLKLPATTVMKITQKITKVETPKSVAIGAGIKFAQGFASGIGFGLGVAAASAAIAAGLLGVLAGLPILAIGLALAAVIAIGLALAFPEQAGMIAGAILGGLFRAFEIVFTEILPFFFTLPAVFFGPFLESTIRFFTDVFGPDLADLFQEVIELDLGGAAAAGLVLIEDLFIKLPTAIINGMAAGWEAVERSFESVLAGISVKVGIDLGSLLKKFLGFGGDVLAFFGAWGPEFAAGFTQTFLEVSGTTAEQWNGIFTTITGIATSIVNTVIDTFASIPGRLAELLGDMRTAGTRIGAAIKDGLKSAFSDVGDLGEAIANGIIDVLNFAFRRINNALPNFIDLPWPLPDIDLPDNPLPTIDRLRHGGPAAAGETVIVNEGETEFFRPFSSGTVLPIAPAGAGAGGGSRLTNYGRIINVYGPGRQSKDVIRDLDRMVK